MSNLAEIKEKGMFYTRDVFSKLLVKNISMRRPENILELGVGNGSLIRYAIDKWKNAKFTCTDINTDEFSMKEIKANVKFLVESGLNTELKKKLKKGKKEFDIAICNPPYLKISMKDLILYKKMIDSFDKDLYENIKLISSEFIFLMQNILLLKEKGILGIIVPDGILTRKEFEPIRRSIMTNYNLLSSIELPERIFSRTEAKTHILILKKEKPKSEFVQVCLSNKEGIIIEEILVPRFNLIERMDFKYLNFNLKNSQHQYSNKLKKHKIKVYRGNISHAELKASKLEYIHSTTFRHNDLIVGKKGVIQGKFKNKVFASENDLVMVRVGRGCAGKIARIKKGSLLVSDCIFVFKCDSNLGIDDLEKYFKSKAGRSQVENLIHGTCSKVISKSDIEKLL